MAVGWWILWILLLALFFVWAGRRTRGRGNKDSGGAADLPSGKYW